jgi:hypothetical protein
MVTVGTGNPRSIALLLHDNGIGDHIHAMPAIWQKVRDGFDVHVYSKPFTRRCFESIGCTWHAMSGPQPGWLAENLGRYGKVYSLSQWCIEHEKATEGKPTLTRFEQFAELIEGELPEEFYWIDHLLPRLYLPEWKAGRVVLALDASMSHRSYPLRQSLVRQLRRGGAHVTELGTLPSQHQTKTFLELIGLISEAAVVVSVDTGPLALALALGTPTVALFGPSDDVSILEQFARYRPSMSATVIRSANMGGCAGPCNWHNGWKQNGKCLESADCMREIEVETVLETIRGMI